MDSQTQTLPVATTRLGWTLATLINVTYTAVFIQLSPLALQDFPAQLARAAVLADLIFHHGSRFGQWFQFRPLAIPYILGDLLLAGCVALLGTQVTAALWSVVAFLSLPAALFFYLRTIRIAPQTRPLLLILTAYLATDWFFLMGFMEFRLSLALVLVTLTCTERLRYQPTAGRFAGFVLMLVIAYLTHLTGLVFTTALLAAIAAFRLAHDTTRLPVEAAILSPCLLLLGWHFGFAGSYRDPADEVEGGYRWGTVFGKLSGLNDELMRFERGPDWLMFFGLVLCLCLQVRRQRWRHWRDPVVLERLALAAVMLAIYLFLPGGYLEASFVDVRALPLLIVFVILACFSLSSGAPGQAAGPSKAALAVATVLTLANLAYLIKHLGADHQWLKQYRAVVAAIPRGASVLPVYTLGSDGRVMSVLHAFAFVVIDRDGLMPYLQTGDTGDPEKYIRYVSRPYAPLWTWYWNPRVGPVDWNTVACQYRFLLVTQPYDPTRLPQTMTTVAQSPSATLFGLSAHAPCVGRPAG